MEAFSIALAALFAGMLIMIWVLPGMINRKGKVPEDFPPRKGGWHVPRSA